MVFSSPTFLFYFLPLFMVLYVVARPLAMKNHVLVASSIVFYAWGEPVAIALLLVSIVFNYAAAILIAARTGRARRIGLVLAVSANLAMLGFFKYANFFVASTAPALTRIGVDLPVLQIALPLGISFFTFHCLSYVIDVYRGRFPANRRLTEVALYIALFPQLVAGPIVRYKTVARQLRQRRHSVLRSAAGLRIFIIGLAQKVLIADQVARIADTVFDHVAHPSLAEAWTGLLAYTIQIYFDFAGYSSMAIGLGLVLGFTLPRNFRMPYASLSITEFWRRWHMSLSAWLRDYLYIPLGGSRRGALKTYRNLVMVFLVCGLWHGASWTFVSWGVWHGAFLVVERAGLAARMARWPAALRWLYCILVVMLGWVLFRAVDADRIVDMAGGLVGRFGLLDLRYLVRVDLMPGNVALLAIGCALAVLPRWIRPLWSPRAVPGALIDGGPSLALLCLSMLYVAASSYSPFLYFRF